MRLYLSKKNDSMLKYKHFLRSELSGKLSNILFNHLLGLIFQICLYLYNVYRVDPINCRLTVFHLYLKRPCCERPARWVLFAIEGKIFVVPQWLSSQSGSRSLLDELVPQVGSSSPGRDGGGAPIQWRGSTDQTRFSKLPQPFISQISDPPRSGLTPLQRLLASERKWNMSYPHALVSYKIY